MKLLEKENWWIWFVLALFSGGSSVLVLGALLDVFDKEAWYYRWTQKLPKRIAITILIAFGIISLVTGTILSIDQIIEIPKTSILVNTIISVFGVIAFFIFIIVTIFQIQILAQVNARLKTPGSEIYLSPYIWILGIIIPIIGWILLLVMYLYLEIWYLVMLYRKEGEKI